MQPEVEYMKGGVTMDEKEFYSGVYRLVQDKGLSGWYVAQSHEMLERGFNNLVNSRILEVGGNVGEHIPYVKAGYSEYKLTDYHDTGFSTDNPLITFEIQDVHQLSFPPRSFDRVIATCLLHHLDNPYAALQEIRRVARSAAVISILIPCDPGLMYRLAKKLGPNRSWKKHGITNPDFFHWTQHKNHYPGLNAAIHEAFKADDIKKSYWPFKFNSWNLNLFAVYQIRKIE